MASKFQGEESHDIRKYMLSSGVRDVLLTRGFIAHVHEVDDCGVILRLPNGEQRFIHFDLSHVPTTVATTKLQRWRKLLHRCQRKSATIRFLGAHWKSGNQWVADETTILLEQAMYLHESDLKLWEWFSGAFGGWSRAAEFLHDQGFPISVVGAADIDPHSTQVWNMNRRLINQKSPAVAQILDVREIENWETVMEAETNGISLSSSCKSFSLAGLKKGWQSEDGQTLATALLFAAQHGFRCIVLENVSNLKHDPKLFQTLVEILKFCGLEIAYEGVISMSSVHPVERTRLIMIIKQRGDEAVQDGGKCDFTSHLEQKAGTSLWGTRRWMTLPDELIHDVILDEQTLDQYAKASSMPHAIRQKVQVWNRVSALFARAITSNMAMPAGTMMAGYNHQHIIAETMGSNQILGSLRHVRDLIFRFVHPIEVVMAMGTVFGVVLPRNIRLSMNGVGNCISEMHALIGLAAGFQVWKDLFPRVGVFQLQDLLMLHASRCLVVGSMCVETTDEQVCMSPIGKNPLSSVQSRCDSDCLPTPPGGGSASVHPEIHASDEHPTKNGQVAGNNCSQIRPVPSIRLSDHRASVDIRTQFPEHPPSCHGETTRKDDEITQQDISRFGDKGDRYGFCANPLEHAETEDHPTQANPELIEGEIPTQLYADESASETGRTACRHDELNSSQNHEYPKSAESVPSTVLDSQVETKQTRIVINVEEEEGDFYRRCRITTVGESMIDPPFACTCSSTSKVSELIEAENDLNTASVVVGVFGDDDVPLTADMTIRDSNIIVSRVPKRTNDHTPGLLVCFDGGGIQLCMEPRDSIDKWTFENQSLSNVDWAHEDGRTFFPEDMIGFTNCITTAHDFGWPQTKRNGHIYVVRVQNHTAKGTWTKHAPQETVGSLLHAEQVLAGPGDRISYAHDRFAAEIEHRTMLQSLTIVVLHIHPNDQNIQVHIQRQDCHKSFRVSRGTRLCAFLHCDADECIVDQKGFEVPPDLPVFSNSTFILESKTMQEDAPLTPTEPFSVHADSGHDSNTSSPEIHRIVKSNTHNIQDRLNGLGHMQTDNDPLAATKRRLDLLCLMGPAIGDDEMAFHVSAIQQAAQEPVAVVIWDSLEERWNRDDASSGTDLFQEAPRKSLVCWIHAHWVPVVIENVHDRMVLEYINSTALTDTQVQTLCELCNCRAAHPSWIFQESASGWCGFEALAWICAKLQTALAPMYHQEKQDILRDMSIVVEPENFVSYCQRTEAFAEQMSVCLNMRLRFIRGMFVRPTSALMHGFGSDEQKPNLKLAGKLAAILIGHGHGDQESIRVSHELADKHAPQSRSIPTMKDARAYASILELTVQHGIPISSLTKTQAVAKLQKFFRLKYDKKQQNSKAPKELDLCRVEFIPRTWMIQNGEYVMPNHTWTVGSKGLSIASIEDIRPYLEQKRLLTTDANSVLLSKPVEVQDPFKIETHEVPVKDQFGNRAIIRVWMLHMGQKPIVRAPATNGDVQLNDMTTLVISVVKDQLDPATWKLIMDAPAKSIIQMLMPDKKPMEIHQIWSRRWSAKGKLVDAKFADSFSMLISVQKTSTADWLILSGVGAQPVYVSPKVSKDAQQAEDQYRVIWLGKQKSDALTHVGTVADHKGIVFKWPSSFGIRVDCKRFPSAWKELKANDDVPSQVRCVFKYICDGVPDGMTGPQLETWASNVQWPVRVLKRFADGRFLIGSEQELPSEHLTINNRPIICQPFIDRSQGKKEQVVAGKLKMPMPQPLGEQPGEDAVFVNDPWKVPSWTHRTRSTSSNGASPWGNYKPTNQNSQDGKQIGDDHTMDMFAKQSSRIADVETELQNIKNQLEAQQSMNENRFAHVEESIQTVNASLCSSLEKALKDQSASLVSTFEALLRQHPRSEPQRSRSPTRSK
eukprot:s275_g27.t1